MAVVLLVSAITLATEVADPSLRSVEPATTCMPFSPSAWVSTAEPLKSMLTVPLEAENAPVEVVPPPI